MQIVRVLLPKLKLFPLDYSLANEISVEKGDLVLVPFRNKEITGIIWEINVISDKFELKSVISKLPSDYKLSHDLVSLITKASKYYLSDLGTIAKLALPIEISEAPIKVKHQPVPADFNLTPLSDHQQGVLRELQNLSKPAVLKGVTGSGKTEIYFHLLSDYLKHNRQILIMLPEIALSEQIIARFTKRFGFAPVIWNSSVTKAQKKMILRGIVTGEVKAVIGARSSLFLPYQNLGLIVIDEEHDISYKQDDGILYNARDMAVLRASIAGIKIVLCSATPSFESIYNCNFGKYQLVELTSRYESAAMPDVEIVDMRLDKLVPGTWLSLVAINAIKQTLDRKEQVLLFLNRRGYCPLVLCRKCGYRYTCPHCSAWLILHKTPKRLECHHCGFQARVQDACPECLDVNTLTPCGPGIERIEEEILRQFSFTKVALLSKDQLGTPKAAQTLLKKMEHNEIEILIGTQIITKGYHFPNLTLVVVVDADLGLVGDDLRSRERTYQLLHQVGGRAGRESKKGSVLLQTYYPDNMVLSSLKNNEEEKFIKLELENRKSSNMPPFGKMASIIIIDKNELKASQTAKNLVAKAPSSNVKLLGPAKSIMSKLSGKYRYRIIIIADKKFNIQNYLIAWLGSVTLPSSVQVKVDIDPQSFY